MSRSSSILIVGAGIVGIACAYYLRKAGFRVTVIDQGKLAQGCSHANCGFVCPSHVLPLTEPGAIGTAVASLFRPGSPFRVRPQCRPALWRWMWEFARRCRYSQMIRAAGPIKAILDSSMAEYRRIVAEENLECEWRDQGLMMVLQTERGLAKYEHTDRIMTQEFGAPARKIAGADLEEFEPALRPGLAGAFYYESDAQVRPDVLNRNWIARLRELEVEFREYCRFQRLRQRRGRAFAAETTGGEIAADYYLLATGAWSARWEQEWRCRLPVEPGKGYSTTLPQPAIRPTHSMLFPEHRVGLTPFADHCRLGSIMEFAGYDETISPDRIRQLHASVHPYLKESPSADGQQTWHGWRPMTWDSLPIIGPSPRLKNAFVATGHNMLGLSMAPGTGRLITELIQNRPPHIDAEPYSPERF